jgi:hypothetical protein
MLPPGIPVPKLNVQSSAGDENAPIPLTISTATADPNESLTVRIYGLPSGAKLSAGHGDDGCLILTPAELPGLTLLPPPELRVAAIAIGANQKVVEAVAELNVTLRSVAEPPVLTAQNAMGQAGMPIPLVIGEVFEQHARDDLRNLFIVGPARLRNGPGSLSVNWRTLPRRVIPRA